MASRDIFVPASMDAIKSSNLSAITSSIVPFPGKWVRFVSTIDSMKEAD
jgi:hypothetical protein